MLAFGKYSLVLSHSFHSFSESSTSKFSFRKPCDNANCNAPSPTNITCGVFSITARATETGCLIFSKQATEPILENSSMIHESSVTRPSRSGRPP